MRNIFCGTMRRVVIALFSVLMLVSMAAAVGTLTKAHAGNPTMTLQASQESAMADNVVQVKINLIDNPGVASLKLNVFYEDFLTLESVEYNSLLGGQATSSNYEVDGSPATLIWVNAFENFTEDDVFATLTFKIAADAEDDAFSEIAITYNPADIYNVDETDINLTVINGSVYVQSCIAGDINGDMLTNNKDITRLFQYLAHWNVEVNYDALDVNGDGAVNNKDITRLFQYLANWDVQVFVSKPYIVKFNGNGGTLVSGKEKQAIKYGKSATAPVYEKEGYTFDGFDADYTNITSNITVNAVWKEAEHQHDYKAETTAPTCTEQGYTTYTCTRCGDSYVGDYVEALEHDYKEGKCTRCNAKDPNYVQTNSDFELWRDSEQAEDFNGDRIITQEDYNIYIEYKKWKNSNYAYDYNGDRKINCDDYLLATNSDNIDLETWLNSDDAYDYNADSFVDAYDFSTFINWRDLIGEFKIINFNYQITPSTKTIYLINSRYQLQDLANDIEVFSFEISKDLKLSCIYDDAVKEKLGEDDVLVQNAVNSCVFEKLSDILTTATFNIQDLYFTVYLTKTENGFSSSISCTIDGISAQISFDISYVK